VKDKMQDCYKKFAAFVTEMKLELKDGSQTGPRLTAFPGKKILIFHGVQNTHIWGICAFNLWMTLGGIDVEAMAVLL